MDEQLHSESARGIHYHNVTVLLSDNVTKRNDQVFMPNTIVMASIKKEGKGQFVNNVKFTVDMSEEDVKRTLLSHFPNLKNQRFFCASAVDNRTRLEFHGEKSVWDGEFMKKTLKGNSALYIFTEITDSEWSRTLPQRPTVHKQCENQVRSGKKSGKRKNNESAPAAKRAKELHVINIQFKPQGHPSTSKVPYQLWNISSDGTVFAYPRIGSKYGLTASEPSPSQRLPSTCLADNTAGGQVSLNTQALGASFMEQAGDQISQNVQASGASLIEPGILHIDPSQQPAATVDQQPISHESPSGLDSIKSSTIGLAVASDTAEQSGATLQMNPPEQTDVTTDQQPIPHDESDSGRDTNREDESIVAGNHADQSRDRSGVMAPCWGYTEESTNFLMSFSTALPDGAESYEFMGDFENLPPVTLEYLNAFTLTGCSPIREDPGKVTVKVYYTSEKGMMQFGDDLCFEYKDRIDEAITVMMANQPARDAIAVGALQGLRSRSRGPRRPNPFSPPQTAGYPPVNKNGQSWPVKLLMLLVYKAAQINNLELLQIIFRTSAGTSVFNRYKNNDVLPEDVARANGNAFLGDYLENMNKRLSTEVGGDDNIETIHWLELKHALEEKQNLHGTDDAQPVGYPHCHVNQSDYEADDEVTSSSSPSSTDADGSEIDDSERKDHGQNKMVKLYMATAPEYTNEQLNYFRVCYLATNIIAEGLRAIFKQEWDGRYKTTLGEWKDEPQNGLHFKNSESPPKQRDKRIGPLLATMVNGNRAEWDCTMLFYAILFSDCIGNGLNPSRKSKVDDLRKFRNEYFAHMPHGKLSDTEFQIALNNVDVSFRALGLSTDQIEEIQNQTSFPADELKNVLKRVEDLRQEVEVLEAQLSKDISAFCVLPPKPTHEVADRDVEVARIVKQLKDLKEANKNRLSYFYISGNPGSGKSQLAGLVSKRVFDQVNEIPHSTSFVMTVNAESPKTLLESYVSFARKLKCPEYVISNTFNSPDLSSYEKISHLKTLMGTKIELYTSWLLVVDNVRSISNIYAHLPESGDEQWARGQLLITTQDIASVPFTSCFICHVSVSKGVELQDARSLLEKLSGISDCETDKVAQVLDYQPLALAIAAIYVKEAKQTNDNFGWRNYLQRLEKGQGVATARIFVETNPTYPKSMTEVLEIAVEEEMKSSNAVLKHTLTLLSFCAAQPLSLEIAVNYIRNVEVDMQDEDDIRMKIRRCPLLLFDENESGVYIRVHQVTHDAVSNVVGRNTQEREVIVLKAIVKALFQFVEDHKLNDPNDLNSVVKGTRTVPHLRTLVKAIRQTYSKENVSEVAENDIFHTSSTLYFNKLAETCYKYFKFAEAKEYYELSSRIQVKTLGPEHVDVAKRYNSLGIIHRNLGKLGEAKEFYDRALAIRLKKLGPDHVDVAKTYANMGSVHYNLVELSQAKEFYDRALAIRLKKRGPDHVDLANTYNNLGCVHSNLGELSQAKEFHHRALAICLKKLGPDHVDVASTYENLGNVHRNLGELSQAKEFYDRALAIRLKKLGPDHVDVAATYANLGSVHYNLGELSQAIKFHHRALAISRKKLGPEHVIVASVYNNMGSVHYNLGELSQAKEFYDRSVGIYLEKRGPDHVDLASTYNNLGCVHRNLGELSQAKEFHDRALAIYLKKLGPDHVDVASTYENLGNVHCNLGELSQAKEFHDRALTIRLKILGPDHVDVASTYHNLGIVYRKLGDVKKGKEYDDRALANLSKTPGPEVVIRWPTRGIGKRSNASVHSGFGTKFNFLF